MKNGLFSPCKGLSISDIIGRKENGKKLGGYDVQDGKTEKAAVTCTKKCTYAGKAVKPAVKVTYGKTTLVKGTDYTVAYANNKKPGKGRGQAFASLYLIF